MKRICADKIGKKVHAQEREKMKMCLECVKDVCGLLDLVLLSTQTHTLSTNVLNLYVLNACISFEYFVPFLIYFHL